jgi:hypothetical protein
LTDGKGLGRDEASSQGGGIAANVEALEMTRLRLTRTARGAAIAALLALVAAAPAAAAQPTRTVYLLHYPFFTIAAGNACDFAVEGHPSWGFQASTEFSDGSIQWSVRAHGAYVNPANGASYWVEDNWRDRDTFEAGTSIVHSVVNGQATYTFYPGDMGPYGLVDHVVMYHIVGTTHATWDNVTYQTYAFSWSGGTITNVCDVLA